MLHACRQLRDFPDVRVELAARAQEAGDAEFDPIAIRSQFVSHLSRAAVNVGSSPEASASHHR